MRLKRTARRVTSRPRLASRRRRTLRPRYGLRTIAYDRRPSVNSETIIKVAASCDLRLVVVLQQSLILSVLIVTRRHFEPLSQQIAYRRRELRHVLHEDVEWKRKRVQILFHHRFASRE